MATVSITSNDGKLELCIRGSGGDCHKPGIQPTRVAYQTSR